MTDNQRNIGITVAVILLLWWVSRKKKEEVLATGGEETTSGGLGGFGGGLGILNITPPTPPPTPVVITGGSTDPTSVTTPPAKNPSGSVADPSANLSPSALKPTNIYSYREGMALRNFTIVASNGIIHNITKGKILKIADVGGSSVTYPEINPSKPLQMGVDVDYATSKTGSIPTGGIAGGLPINTGTSTGGSAGNVGGVLGGNPNPSGTPTNSSTGAIPMPGGAIKL
jgi:hypothetical protein